jgi:hypothetical protein
VPDGDYAIIVENVEWRQSKDKIDATTGELSEYWNWELVITDGPFEGRHLWTMTSLSEKALFRIQQFLVNLRAIEPGEGMVDPEYDEDTNAVLVPELVERTGVARVKGRTWNGETRPDVNKMLSDDGTDLLRTARSTPVAAAKAPSAVAPVTNGAPTPPRLDRSAMKLR